MSAEHVAVAVVGAGIGGLVTALALRRTGVRVVVFEQTEALTEEGAGLALGANGIRPLLRLGLGAEMQRVAFQPSRVVFRHWRTGGVRQALPLGRDYEDRFGAPYYTFHRADLRRLLAERYRDEGGELRTGHRCLRVTPSADRVVVEFDGDRRVEAGVVVGADGVHSAVRTGVVGADRAVYSGRSGYRGLVAADLVGDAVDDELAFHLGPNRHLVAYPVHGGDTVNFLAVVRDPRWTRESWVRRGRVADVLAAFAGWSPAVTRILGAADEVSHWGLFDREPVDRWSLERVTLVGDAAHPMLPHQGQGGNQAVEDAVVLAACLRTWPDRPALALDRYERARRTRTRMLQRGSRHNGECYQLPDGPAADARDAKLRRLPEDMAWIHGYDAETALATSEGTHHGELV
ncbi:FAD-dependent monooxygenase [Saccharothrix texasensis]|uniref:Salicylate hydroxylase n=1 Tax=Saccharothrix texasensis TaxID=103734 RepID=A0A3N1HJ70_9PSEU|nr:FAD-dependent monooxygenase [Saccharothrix texasensis]ROP42495.1 salicylate hydroxylase [Saccharothrix texasensis]